MKPILALFSILFAAQVSQAMSVTLNASPVSCASPTSGFIDLYVSGGTPPYTYLWNNGSTDGSIYDLGVGTYSVTVTDDLGEQATESATVSFAGAVDLGMHGIPACPEGEYRMIGGGWLIAPGPCTFADSNFGGGWLDSGDPNDNPILYVYGNMPAPGTLLSLDFTDVNGCPGSVSGIVPYPSETPVPQILSIEGACSDGSNGRVLLHVPTSANNWEYDLHFVDSFGLVYSPVNTIFGDIPKDYEATGLGAGTYAIVLKYHPEDTYDWASEVEWNTDPCLDTTWFTVPDLGYTCGTVSGTVYMDDNMDCTAPDGTRVPGQVLQISPGGYVTMTNAQGQYQTNLPYGSYTIEQTSAVVQEHCVGGPQAFDLSVGAPFAVRNFADTALLPLDAATYVGQRFARPGFQTAISVGVKNLTYGATGAVTVSLTIDPLLTYSAAQPPPSDVTGNTITWTLPQLTSFGHRDVLAYFDVPPDVNLIGTVLTNSATVGIAQPEVNLANNTVTFQQTITGAVDPNSKEVATSSRQSSDLYLIDQDQWLDYTIQFQNTGTDTAFTVVITDTLPSTLDPTTFEFGTASHSVVTDMSGHGTLRFTFSNILLPDSIVNEPKSHGFVNFRIKPMLPLLPGTTIENIANIYFDYNEPVITDPSVLTAEFSTGITSRPMPSGLLLSPVPVHDVLHFTSERKLTGVQVIAADGRLVLSTPVHGLSGNIRVSELKAGTYLILGLRNDGSTARQRFVKQ
jgi:uncharacterized repeat protein (TIGR01451 family)